MKSRTTAPRIANDPVYLVRWVFHRRGSVLTCQVESDRKHSAYDVSVVPHWDVGAAVVERAQTPVGALRRHAEIALQLREAGWSLAYRA